MKMMNTYKTKSCILALLLVALLLGMSCKKLLETEPEDKVSVENAYQNLSDADAAVFGVYGKFIGLAKPYILLNELRGDMMDVTTNADPYLQQISSNTVTKDNPYTDPKQFYEVILNCNDVLKHFNSMVKDKKISVDEYNQRYSDIGVLRSWIYLQLGIHYGNVPYITQPVESIDDIQDVTVYPKIAFSSLVDSLLNFTAKLPYISESYAYPASSTLTVTIDGAATRRCFINKVIFLGDLNLWKGNYTEAARNYRIAMDVESENSSDIEKYHEFKVAYRDATVPTTLLYNRGQEESSLENSTTSGWRAIFGLGINNRTWNTEWYWALPYSSSFKPGNPFIELCSNTYGKYLVKPSKAAIDLWNSQTQSNGIPYDARGLLSYTPNGAAGTVTPVSPILVNNPVITKLTDNAGILTALNRSGQWNIWRATGVHLHFAEAANRDGKSKVAWALLNTGIANTYNPGGANSTLAQLNAAQTPDAMPYYFDARANSDIHGRWYRNTGIRQRSGMPALSTTLQDNANAITLEDKLLEEGALELAFEGSRWSDLLRIAIRRNDPAILADKIFNKLQKSGNPNAGAVRAKLMAKDWYLPFKW